MNIHNKSLKRNKIYFSAMLIFMVLCLLMAYACDNTVSRNDYIIHKNDGVAKAKLVQKLIENKISHRVDKNGAIYIKKSDSKLVSKMNQEIESELTREIYSAEFTSLEDAKEFGASLSEKKIPYKLNEVCCPRYKIVCPPGYFDQADLVMIQYLKRSGVILPQSK